MRRALWVVLLASYIFPFTCQQVGPASNISDEEYWHFFQRSWQKHKDLFRSSGGLMAGCLVEDETGRNGVLKHDEVANLVIGRHTLYGPGINATTLPSLLWHYKNFFRVVFGSLGVLLMGSDVPVQSDFSSPALQNVCTADLAVRNCPFDHLQYSTVTMHLDLGFTRGSKCWRVISRKDRMILVSVWEDAVHKMGFPGVHLLDFLSGHLFKPDPRTKYLSVVKLGIPQEALNVTLEIFGPCAVPFGLEKQTLLREALLVVLERDINSNVILVKAVHYSKMEVGSEGSVNVTMTIGVYVDEVAQTPYFQAFQNVVTSKERGQPPLIKYLSKAGLTTTRIVVHQVVALKHGPADSPSGSLRVALKVAEQKAEEDSANKGSFLGDEPLVSLMHFVAAVFVAALLVVVIAIWKLMSGGATGWLSKWQAHVNRPSPMQSTSAPATGSVSSVFSSKRKQLWACGVMEEADIQLIVDADGKYCRLGTGASGEVLQGLYRGIQPVAIKVLNNISPDEHQQEKLLTEVAVLRACRHPHIVSFQGVAFVSNRVFAGYGTHGWGGFVACTVGERQVQMVQKGTASCA
eukprot:jgi/Botrbrau1/3161/Bobra.0070s0126.1